MEKLNEYKDMENFYNPKHKKTKSHSQIKTLLDYVKRDELDCGSSSSEEIEMS
jgi:hypothetical protein